MVTNFSLNDNTQKEILKHLEITSKLLSKGGESINIGNDVAVRTNGMHLEQVKQHIEKVLDKCTGIIYGQMHQLFARTKYGDFDYSRRDVTR